MSCKKLRLSNELEFDNHESNSNENWLQENAGPSQPDSFQGIKRKQNAIKIAPKTAAWKKTFIDVYIKGENREQYSMNEPQSELDIFSSCSYDVFEPILQNLDFIDLLNLYHTNTFYGKMARTYYFHKYRKLTVSLTSNFTTNERFFYVCDGEFVIQDFKTTMEVLRCFGDMIESMEVINSNSFISMSHFEKFLRMAEYVSQYCGNLINFKYSGVLEKSIRNLFLTNIYEKKLTIEVFCEFEHYGQIDRAKKHEHCFKISKYSSNFELVIIANHKYLPNRVLPFIKRSPIKISSMTLNRISKRNLNDHQQMHFQKYFLKDTYCNEEWVEIKNVKQARKSLFDDAYAMLSHVDVSSEDVLNSEAIFFATFCKLYKLNKKRS